MAYGPENDADKHLPQYLTKITTVKISPIDHYIPKYSIRDSSYKAGLSLIGYKGLFGKRYIFRFQDSISKKHFAVQLFDKSMQSTFSLDEELVNKEILAYVDTYCLSNPLYGTKQNPIPIFSFKGIKEPIRIVSDNPGSVNGYKILEPTQTEYEHNVYTYLRYVMPQKEFKERFEGKK
jgi:hypothetical protein